MQRTNGDATLEFHVLTVTTAEALEFKWNWFEERCERAPHELYALFALGFKRKIRIFLGFFQPNLDFIYLQTKGTMSDECEIAFNIVE